MQGTNDRGVSDVVAFALVFSMVITIVTATFVLGVDSIEALSNDGQMQTADDQMKAVAASFDDIHRRGSVARSIEVELDGGTLELSDSNIEVDTGSGFTSYSAGALELQREQGVIAYEVGAVTRQDSAGSNGLITRDPALYCGGSTAIISVVELDPSTPISVGGQDSIRLIGRLGDQTAKTTTTTSVTVDISALSDSTRAAWRTYLQRADGWNPTGGGTPPTRFECTSVTKVVVRTTTITLETQR